MLENISSVNPAPNPIPNREITLSSSLSTIFRGRLCRILLQNRSSHTESGEEVIFDIRKAGEVVGELSASSSPHIDRAVALEPTEAVEVSYSEVLETVQKNQPLLRELIQLFCDSLLNAHEQVTSLAFRDTMQRLTKTLLDLTGQLGRPVGDRVEITARFTQEEIAQMVAARRERVSLGLNHLRRNGMIDYTTQGHLLVDPAALRNFRAQN